MKGSILLSAVLLSFPVGSVAIAHENHEELGAGPSPAATLNQQAPRSGLPAAPQSDASVPHGDGQMEAHMDGMAHRQEQADAPKSFGHRLARWLGRLHTIVVHFPIAMTIGAFAVELFGLWRRSRDYQHVAFVMLIVGALGAIVAAFLGWFAGGFYLSDRNAILMTHRGLARGLPPSAVSCFHGYFLQENAGRSRTLLLVLLGLAATAISIQGFLGGTFMHGGLRHLAF